MNIDWCLVLNHPNTNWHPVLGYAILIIPLLITNTVKTAHLCQCQRLFVIQSVKLQADDYKLLVSLTFLRVEEK